MLSMSVNTSMHWVLRDLSRACRHVVNICSGLAAQDFWVSPARVRSICRNADTFFVLACGRSGTKFLSALLNNDRDATVVHEPVPEDFVFCNLFRDEPGRMRAYLRYRRRRILRLIARASTYGEITPALSLGAPLLPELFPNSRFLHLVRDGRDVVRSIMSRAAYFRHRDFIPGFNPAPSVGDPLRDRWGQLSRFGKACWQWTRINARIGEAVETRVKLEDLSHDYRCFRSAVARPLGLDIGEQLWGREVHRPKNVTKTYSIPHWTEWSAEKVRKFQSICGDMMSRLGYGAQPGWREKCRRAGAAVPRQ